MKKYILLAIAAVVALSGCVKDKETEFSENQVSFNATSGSLETRTYYGSETENNLTFVNWKDGDEVTIMSTFSDGSRNPVNYTIENRVEGTVTPEEGIKISNAKIFPTDETSVIEWGAGTNVFYGMYPKTGTGPSRSLSMVKSVPTMTCDIPASWTPSSETLGELPYGYMFARTQTTRTTEVQMTFNPKFTAFYFTLKNDDTDNPIELTSLTLSSTSQALNGTFSVDTSSDAGTVSITNPNASESATVQTANKSVTVKFPSSFSIPPKSGSTPGSRSFTVVVLPKAYPQLSQQEYEDLGLTNGDYFKELTVAVTNTANITKHLVLKRNGNWIPFAAGKKHNISITLPEFATWTYQFGVTTPPTLDAGNATGTNSVPSGVITSYKTNDGGTSKISVGWDVVGYYDTAEKAAAWANPDYPNNTNTSAASWLSSISSAAAGTPFNGTHNLTINYTHAATSHESGLRTIIDNQIQANTSAGGTSSSPKNLANPNNEGTTPATYIAESANCYIVNGPGWYKIPVVMGNGVKSDAKNSNKYTYEGKATVSAGSGGARARTFYTHIRNSSNQIEKAAITTPILAEPDATEVIWQDVSGLVSSPSIMSGTGATSTVSGTTVYWLKFQVPDDPNPNGHRIQQGNAIIAVKNSSEDVTWSYHIWVTSYNPENALLGWVTTAGAYYQQDAVSVYLRLRQKDGDNYLDNYAVLPVVVPAGNPTSPSVSNGYAPYYQWGRKDPIMPGVTIYNGNGQKTFSTFTHNNLVTSNEYGAPYYYYSILHPGDFIQNTSSSSTATRYFLGGTDSSMNYWCAERYGTGTPSASTVNKTIFDPCPAGYSVPYENYFNNNSFGFIPSTGTNFGYRVHRVYVSRASDFENSGAITDSNNLMLWTATPSSTTNQAMYFNGSSTGGTNMGNALCILAMPNAN